MTKLVFFLFRDKDGETLLRVNETNITIILHLKKSVCSRIRFYFRFLSLSLLEK